MLESYGKNYKVRRTIKQKTLNRDADVGPDEMAGRASVEKLVITFEDRDKYVSDYRNVHLYQQLGMELRKIHCVIDFQQAPWLKTYIEFDSEERKKAKSLFQKNFYKLMNKSVFSTW